jgi:hypothetical protein
MIELTPEQRQAVEQGRPVRLVDPTTHDAYILVREDVYEPAAGPLLPPIEEALSLIHPAMLQAQQAFWRDLPALLKDRRIRGQWVAYYGDERVGLGRDDAELYRECLRRGFGRDGLYVARTREREYPPWQPEFLEKSLYEASEPLPDVASPPA